MLTALIVAITLNSVLCNAEVTCQNPAPEVAYLEFNSQYSQVTAGFRTAAGIVTYVNYSSCSFKFQLGETPITCVLTGPAGQITVSVVIDHWTTRTTNGRITQHYLLESGTLQ